MVPIYRLNEDALHADSFSAKQGDLLLGGGSGECPVLRISIPEAFSFFTQDDLERMTPHEEICRAYWSMNDAFVFCEGYHQLGWQPDEQSIEMWLTKHILAFLIREYPAEYGRWQQISELHRNGDICRLPTPQEMATL
jgi:hypothetical protein